MKKHLKSGDKNLPYLQGKTATILFYENSTRTRTSFELAAKYLGATVINIAASSSSVAKGETLVDTGKTLDAQLNDFLIMRHPMGGAPYLLAKVAKAGVLNFSKGMYLEMQPHNVRVTCIVPSSASTGFQSACGIGETTDLLLPEDIAETVLYVANLPQRAVVEDVTVWGIDKQVNPL